MMRRRTLHAAVLLALLAVPAGCGGGDDDPPASARTATTPSATTPQTTGTTGTTPGTPPTTSTTASTTPQTERNRISTCLTAEGYRLQGGAPRLDDTDAPDYQILLTGPRGGGFIGFYKNESRAKRVAAQLRKNATRVEDAGVERHGAINIVWIDLPDEGARERVRACLTT